MSFSGKVKEELSVQIGTSRHCQIAELAAILAFCGDVCLNEKKEYCVKVQTENLAVARKYFTLLKKTFNIDTGIRVDEEVLQKKNGSYCILIQDATDVNRILQALKFADRIQNYSEKEFAINSLITQSVCCKRAFIRGAFLAAGSISNPEKFYHFEIVCGSEEKAEKLKHIINSFQMDSKIVHRKKYYVVYIKEGAQIVDMLNVMEAHVSLMNLENLRILKEMRNSVNRRVNCETANIHKTVSAAVKQLEDIRYIKSSKEYSNLSDGLREIAEARLYNPDATLKELGEMLMPTVGKSGVNHRLRKLSELADKLKEQKEELK